MPTNRSIVSRTKQALKTSLRVFAHPPLLRQRMLRRRLDAPLAQLVEYDALPFPDLAYGLFHAARLAQHLKIPRITAMEFGVGDGSRLVAMVDVADRIERELGVETRIFGFDYRQAPQASAGMKVNRTADLAVPIDLPRFEKRGERGKRGGRRPLKEIQERLPKVKILPGEFQITLPIFLFRQYTAPIGFVSLGELSASDTFDALNILDATTDFLLPRILMSFSDVVGSDLDLHCEFAGPLSAVRCFNESHINRKVAPIHGLEHKRLIPATWNTTLHAAHIFDHPGYGVSPLAETSAVVVKRPVAGERQPEPTVVVTADSAASTSSLVEN